MSLLSAQQVAERLGVSRRHVGRLLDSGELPYVRVPGTGPAALRRVDPADLERWIDAHKTMAA